MICPIPAIPSRVTSLTLSSNPLPPDADPRIVVRLYGATDVGHTREHNEDSFLVADLEAGSVVSFEHGSETCVEGTHGLLFMVADGMGGAAAGEIASSMAVQVVFDELRTHWRSVHNPTPDDFAVALRDASETANTRMYTFAREHPEHRGMGTTATAVGLLGDRVYIAQVGDSRAYLMRDNTLILLTRDQSLMQRLVDAGEISEEQAEVSSRRNIILQALGPEPSVTIDLTHQQIRLGDTLIVCSDGLSSVVKGRDIEEVVRAQSDPAVLAHALIARANELGGPDNITVVVARFEGAGLRSAMRGDAVGRAVYPLRGTLADDERTPPRGATVLADPAGALGGALRVPPNAALAPEHGPAKAPPSSSGRVGAHGRHKRARPVLLLLLLLGVAAATWLVYELLTTGTA